NNKMSDIKNQIAFITKDQDNVLSGDGIESVEYTLKMAQTVFNRWSELPSEKRTTENILNMIDPEYFHLLDLLTIARSRKHIEKYYGMKEIGECPERLKPENKKADIDIEQAFLGMDEVNDRIEALTFGIYKPMNYILPAKRKYYEELYDTKIGRGSGVFKQTDRESAVASLMKVNIFKRLESSIHSFNKTLERLVDRLEKTINLLHSNKHNNVGSMVAEDIEDMDDDVLESITV